MSDFEDKNDSVREANRIKAIGKEDKKSDAKASNLSIKSK